MIESGSPPVLDAFHVVKLANQAVGEVRRRVPQDTLGQRDHKDDPLYRIRRLLTRNQNTLTDSQAAKPRAALHAGDPDSAVELSWQCAQRIHAIYRSAAPRKAAPTPRGHWTRCTPAPLPEIARIGGTLRRWEPELLAHFDTGGAS